MRKVQKDSIIEIANLLKKAQEHIRILLKKQEYASVLDLLQQCQQGAIQIGTIIEQSEGEGFSTVKLLEEYCELVFQVFEMVQNNAPADADVVFGAMDRLLADVSESICKDIAVRKEVVFLPYKASMWDSLESVWMAADADPECDAYVVPIPYFDKNPDGTAKEMHYEGDLFPKYVPVTHYEKYDIAQRHPDMIYIHNPYDETNFVTSVHPAFYSKCLKELTDCLVYIPYFVLGEINPKNKAAVKGMEHFVTVPGVIHAHKVVVQSEAMRQIYIDVMTELTGKDTKYYWEQKILGTGSPKFDKVHNTKKEDVEVPAEWLSIIEKPSGEWKKIIFYNTSVSALLQHSDKMLDKMRDVFGVFKKNKEEVALLWRPHPLIKATIESMRPQLWEDYRKLVEEYKEEGWGIYDDTPDMDRAVALCDGYYGDGSSVVQLVREAGKPVMLQDVNVRDTFGGSDEIVLLTEDGVRVEDDFYFISKEMNLVCALNLISGEIEIIGSLPEEELYTPRLGAKIIYWRNELVFVPMKAKKIWILNLETKEWQGYERKIAKGTAGMYFQATLYNDKLFMIGTDCPFIMCMDMVTRQLRYIKEPYDRLKKVKETVADIFFRCDFVRKDNMLYLASCLDNYVLKFDMDRGKGSWLKIGSKDNRYAGIAFDGKNFWLALKNKAAFVKWDGKDEVSEYFLSKEVVVKPYNFLGVVIENNKLISPGFIGTDTIEMSREIEGTFEVMAKGFSLYKKIDDEIIISQTAEDGLCVKHGVNDIKQYRCTIDMKKMKNYVKQHEKTELILQEILQERYVLGLRDFCERIMFISDVFTIKRSGNYGREIWDRQ